MLKKKSILDDTNGETQNWGDDFNSQLDKLVKFFKDNFFESLDSHEQLKIITEEESLLSNKNPKTFEQLRILYVNILNNNVHIQFLISEWTFIQEKIDYDYYLLIDYIETSKTQSLQTTSVETTKGPTDHNIIKKINELLGGIRDLCNSRNDFETTIEKKFQCESDLIHLKLEERILLNSSDSDNISQLQDNRKKQYELVNEIDIYDKKLICHRYTSKINLYLYNLQYRRKSIDSKRFATIFNTTVSDEGFKASDEAFEYAKNCINLNATQFLYFIFGIVDIDTATNKHILRLKFINIIFAFSGTVQGFNWGDIVTLIAVFANIQDIGRIGRLDRDLNDDDVTVMEETVAAIIYGQNSNHTVCDGKKAMIDFFTKHEDAYFDSLNKFKLRIVDPNDTPSKKKARYTKEKNIQQRVAAEAISSGRACGTLTLRTLCCLGLIPKSRMKPRCK